MRALSLTLVKTQLFLVLAGFVCLANALTGDDEFLNAKAAYDKKNNFALADSVDRLKKTNYILAPYADYWLMLLNLDEANNQNVADFLTHYDHMPFADRLRGEWLKKLGKQQDWTTFLEAYPQYQLEDSAVACYAAEANAVMNDVNTLESVKPLWLQSKEQAANCSALYDRMQAAKVLTENDLQDRFRLALADNRVSLAKAIAKRSQIVEASFTKQIDSAYTSPQLMLKKKSVNAKNRYGRELYLYALSRIAKTDSVLAEAGFNQIDHLLNAEEKSYFYATLAQQATLRLEPEAVSWFKMAENTTLKKEQLEAYARIALRQSDWKSVMDAIALMPPEQAEESAWRYWKARALKAQNQIPEANSLFATLSTERHFYGWLAQEELEASMSAPPESYEPSDAEVATFEKVDAVQRADALQRLDFRWEAKMEWAVATDGLEDKQLLAAAKYAMQKKWYDLAVITADKTKEVHNFALRYPTPYRDLMKPAANQQNIDEAWVYGIIRQESRFMHYAKSNVGAAGLMQIMPATAKWVANKVGWSSYSNSMIHELDTNITLGTTYMRYTVDQFNGQEATATAAYNAGPSRAKKWMANTPLEGAIYAETIPFSETRNYVKKVMANAHLYAPRLGLKSVPLKKRLGVIPANSLALETSAPINE